MTYFGIGAGSLATGLATISTLALGGLIALAWWQRALFRLAVRNIPRRRTQMVLIGGGVMLSTMLLSCALATGDTMTATMHVEVLQQMGRADEIATAAGADFFPDAWYTGLRHDLAANSLVAGLVPAVNRGQTVVADMTARQIKSGVALLGVPARYSPAFGSLRDLRGRPVSLADLRPGEVYPNAALARSLAAAPGHRLYAFLEGRRVALRVRAVLANGGLTGTRPTLLLSLGGMQALTGHPNEINRILVANSGVGAQAVDHSDDVSWAVQNAPTGAFTVQQVKAEAVRAVSHAQDIFNRIFALFTLFAVSISVLLIVLIFTMLAAERRTEMGVTRALGAQRGHLIAAFVFEGAVYDVVASLLGLLAGIILGELIIRGLAIVLERFDVHIGYTMSHQSMALAYCVGALSTLLAVFASSWWVSRLNLVAAIRGLPDTPSFGLGITACLGRLVGALRRVGADLINRRWWALAPALASSVAALAALLWALTARGVLLVPLGLWLVSGGVATADVTSFAVGVSLLVLAIGLLARAALRWAGVAWPPLGRWADRCGYTLVGLGLLGYWALPYDLLYGWGVPRFSGGIEVFFLAGLMMISGAVAVAVYNVEALLWPLRWLLTALGRTAVALRTALAYPLHHKFRTGMTMAMFAMVVFALTVMTVVSYSSQDSYDNPNAMGNGFNIAASAIYTPVPRIASAMASSPYVRPDEFSAIGTQTYQPVGMIQLGAAQTRWRAYQASVVNAGFLRGTQILLGTRARGYTTDAQVWQAIAANPRLAVIDSRAVLSRNGYADQLPFVNGLPVFQLRGVAQEDRLMDPTPVWVAAVSGGRAFKLTIIGVIDSRAYDTGGLFINQAALVAADAPVADPANYYFRTRPSLNPETEKRRIEAAFLDHGLEASVVGDEILRQQGPRMLVSGMLEGFVGLTLLMGVVALGLVAARSVVERRQQIAMLRALGYRRRDVSLSLLLEASFVALLGSVAGLTLGLALCQNMFTSNFFEQFKSGMLLNVPWDQLGAILAVTYLALLVTTAVPAWQAARIVPAEALRYE